MEKSTTQINFRMKGDKLCVDHPTEELLLVCNDCQETLVCMSCISTTHSGHKVVAIHLLIKEKFNFLQDFRTEAKDTKIPKISKRLQEADSAVKHFIQGIQQHITKVEDRGEYLKQLIDKSTYETIYKLEEIKNKIANLFEKFEHNSTKAIKLLEGLMQESREATQSDSDVLLLDVAEEFRSLSIQEPQFEFIYNPMKFIEGSDAQSHINAALGILVTLSEIPDVITLVNTLSSIRTVTQTKCGTLWFCQDDESILYKMDKKEPLEKLTTDVNIKDISTHPLNDQLYCISRQDNSLRKLDTRTMKTTKLFIADNPICMAVTKDGSILVKTRRQPKVTVYTCTGDIVQTISTTQNVNHISVCRITGKVAFSCLGAGVVVTNEQLQHLFKYPTSGDEIYIQDATFDRVGHLLISDYWNKKIHIIDATTGHSLQIVSIDSGLPSCLAVNSLDSIVVCTNEPEQILSVKYQTTAQVLAKAHRTSISYFSPVNIFITISMALAGIKVRNNY